MKGRAMDNELVTAIEALHSPSGWVHLGTVGQGGEPHVTPVMMGVAEDALVFSVTGNQKKRNVEADPRVCVSLSRDGDLAHVVVWGDMTLHTDGQAQARWEDLIRTGLGEDALNAQRRPLSREGTSLGLVTPRRWRVFGLDHS